MKKKKGRKALNLPRAPIMVQTQQRFASARDYNRRVAKLELRKLQHDGE